MSNKYKIKTNIFYKMNNRYSQVMLLKKAKITYLISNTIVKKSSLTMFLKIMINIIIQKKNNLKEKK